MTFIKQIFLSRATSKEDWLLENAQLPKEFFEDIKTNKIGKATGFKCYNIVTRDRDCVFIIIVNQFNKSILFLFSF